MVTFIKMVITRIKNGSPDMILKAFDGKFQETKYMRYLPGPIDFHMRQNIQYWEVER